MYICAACLDRLIASYIFLTAQSTTDACTVTQHHRDSVRLRDKFCVCTTHTFWNIGNIFFCSQQKCFNKSISIYLSAEILQKPLSVWHSPSNHPVGLSIYLSIYLGDVSLVEFLYPVFIACNWSYRRRLVSVAVCLACWMCDVNCSSAVSVHQSL